MRMIVIAVICSILLNFSVYVAAQESYSEVKAEVAYHAAHLRNGPAMAFRSLELLPQGTSMYVIAFTNRNNHQFTSAPSTWLLVRTIPDDVPGWIRADTVTLDDADWRKTVPFLLVTEIGEAHVAQGGSPIVVRVTSGSGSVSIRSGASYQSPSITQLSTLTPVQIIGQDETQRGWGWLYVRVPESGIEGWVGPRSLWSMGRVTQDFIRELPVIPSTP